MRPHVTLKQSIKEDFRWLLGGFAIAATATGCTAAYYHRMKAERPPQQLLKAFREASEFEAAPWHCCHSVNQYDSAFKLLKSHYGLSSHNLLPAITHLCPIEYHVVLVEHFLKDVQTALQEPLCVDEKKGPTSPHVLSTSKGSRQTEDTKIQYTAEALRSLIQSVIDQHTDSNPLRCLREIEFDDVIQKWIEGNDASSCSLRNTNQANHTKTGNVVTVDVDNKSIGKLLCSIREAIYDYLVPNWMEMRYFDAITYKDGFFGHQFSTKAIGLNIGTKVPPFLLSNHHLRKERENTENRTNDSNEGACTSDSTEATLHKSLHLDNIEGSAHSLRTYGLAVIRNCLSEEQIKHMTDTLFRRGHTGKIAAEELMKADGNVFSQKPTLGRLHCLLRGTKIEESLLQIQSVWMPLVYHYLKTETFDNDISKAFLRNLAIVNSPSPSAKIDATKHLHETLNESPNPSYRRLFVSCIQAIFAEPLAISQYWHRENVKPGITIFIPLTSLSSENGTIELLAGSHLLKSEKKMELRQKWNAFLRFLRLFEETNGAYTVNLDVGDALVCDSRLVHRLMANESWLTSGVLMIQYDYEEYRPPGQNLLDTRITAIQGKLAKLLQKLYELS